MLCFRSRLLSIKSSWCACFSALLGNQPCQRIIQLMISWGVPPLLRQNNIRVKDSLLPVGVAQIILQPCCQWEKHITIDDLKQLPFFLNCSRFAQQMKLASVLIRVAIFKNGNVLNNIERDISGLKFFWSLYSRELAGIPTLLAQCLRAVAQYTFVMSSLFFWWLSTF